MSEETQKAEQAPNFSPSTQREALVAWSDAKTDAERKAVMEKHPQIKNILSPGHWSHL